MIANFETWNINLSRQTRAVRHDEPVRTPWPDRNYQSPKPDDRAIRFSAPISSSTCGRLINAAKSTVTALVRRGGFFMEWSTMTDSRPLIGQLAPRHQC